MNKIYKCKKCKEVSSRSVVCPYCRTNQQVELKSIELNARKAKKYEKLVLLLRLFYDEKITDIIDTAGRHSLCEEGCPLFGTCKQKTFVNWSKDQTDKYCTKQFAKWWRA